MKVKKLKNSSVELTLNLEAAKIEENYKKVLNDYSKKIVMKGFRQGKAPVSLIESKYGAEIREEATLKLMEDNLEASYKDLDEKDRPLPYSTPVLQDEDKIFPLKPNTDLTYSVIYDVLPEVKLPAYTGLELETEAVKVTADQVKEEIEKLRQQNAMIVAKNGAIADGDIVTMDYAELDKDGKDIANTKRDDFTFTVGSSYNFYQLDKDIIGLKKGDKKVIEKKYDDDSKMGSEYLGKTISVRVEIKDVKYKDVPALDDEFAQDIKDEYKTVEDLKKATKKQLEEKAEVTNRSLKLEAVVQNLSKNTKIDLPESMVNAQLEQDWRSFAQRFGMSEEEVEKLMSANGGSKADFLNSRKEETIENLKVQLILEQVKKEQKFKVSEKELEEELKNYSADLKKDDPNYEAFKIYAEDDVQYRKAKDYLIDNNTFKVVEKKEEKKSAEKKPAEKKTTTAKSTATKTTAEKKPAAKKAPAKKTDK